jgi:ribonuclease PH
MTGSGQFVELQGTGEESTFSREQLNHLLDLGEKGVYQLIEQQKEVLDHLAAYIPVKER